MASRGHFHANIEMNYLESGGVTYLLAGRMQSLRAGEAGVFWAAHPHRIAEALPGTRLHWATVPMEDFLSWEFPENFFRRLFGGELLIDRSSRPERDLALFTDNGADRRIALLELQARLLRLEAGLREPPPPQELATGEGARFLSPGAIRMAAHIATHFREPLRLEDIAGAAGLHPVYAARLFRRVFGMTAGDFLAQSRVARAIALLRTTDAGILEIALEAGFASSSRFYETFRKVTGRTPKSFRHPQQ